MQTIQITNETVHRYKSVQYVPSGTYWVWPGKPTPEEKRILPFVASDYNRFAWLLPVEAWITRLLGFGSCGTIPTQWRASGEVFLAFLASHAAQLKTWQKDVLGEIEKTLLPPLCTHPQKFRKGLIAGLGGGKTLVALLALSLYPGRCLYVAPRHLHSTIVAEAEKWGLPMPAITTPESSYKYEGTHALVLDECLSCKNPEAIRAERVTQVARECDLVLAMTGTPISARRAPDARWLRVATPCVPAEEWIWKWIWGINPRMETVPGGKVEHLVCDGYRVKEVADAICDHCTTVDISDIIKELPPLTYQTISLPRPREYGAILSGLLTEKSVSKRLTQARCVTSGFVYSDQGQVLWLNKTTNPAKMQWVSDFVESNPDEPVVIFSNWQAEQSALAERLATLDPACVTEDGGSEEVERFVSGKTNLLICSANRTEGMNLQRARIAIFMSNSSSPVKRVQAVGRVFRQGQTRGVVVYDLVCKDTLDERTLGLLQAHQDESDTFVNAMLAEELNKCYKLNLG